MKLPGAVKDPCVMALRLGTSFAILSALLTWAGGGYATPLTALFQRQIELFRPGYDFRKFKYVSLGPQNGIIQLELKVVVDPRDRKTGARKVKGYYPVETLILQPLIVLSVLFALPFKSWLKRMLSLGLGVCGLVLAFLIDLPFHIIQVIESSLHEYANFGFWMKVWVDFLSGGGRLVLTITVILLAAFPYRQWSYRRLK